MDEWMDDCEEGVSEWERGREEEKVSASVKLGMIRANMEDAISGQR